MGSDNKNNNQKFAFGKFGKVVIRKSELPKEEDQIENNSMSAVSSAGVVIGSVTVATSIYSDDLLAGATGVPY